MRAIDKIRTGRKSWRTKSQALGMLSRAKTREDILGALRTTLPRDRGFYIRFIPRKMKMGWKFISL